MKRYHEAVNVRIGDSIVAYFLQDTRVLKDPYDTKALVSLPWSKVSSEEFVQLVKQDEVQFLTVENDKIVCHLTDEERKLLTKNKLKRVILTLWRRITGTKTLALTKSTSSLQSGVRL